MRTSSFLLSGVTAAATALGLVVATPAYAATPALEGGGFVRASFAVDADHCSATGTETTDEATVTVPTSGSRSFTGRTSGTVTAVDSVDASDTVTMTGGGVAKGSARGAGGAFASLSATLSASATISTTLASSTCKPQSTTTVGTQVNARVRKAGTITVTITVREGGSVELFVAPQGSLQGADVSATLRPGTYTISAPVRPGVYVVAAALQATASRAAPDETLKASTSATVAAAYRAS